MSWMNDAESKRKKVESEASRSKRQEDDERARDEAFWSQYHSTVEYLLRDMGNAWGGIDAKKISLSMNPKKYHMNSSAPYYHHDSDGYTSGWRHGVVSIGFQTGDSPKPIYGAENGFISVILDGTKGVFEILPNGAYGQKVFSSSIDSLKVDLATLWQEGKVLTYNQVGESLQSHRKKKVLFGIAIAPLAIIGIILFLILYVAVPFFISSVVVIIASAITKSDIILAIIFILSFIASIGFIHSWVENK